MLSHCFGHIVLGELTHGDVQLVCSIAKQGTHDFLVEQIVLTLLHQFGCIAQSL